MITSGRSNVLRLSLPRPRRHRGPAYLAAICLAWSGLALAGGSATIESRTPEGPVRMDVSWSGDDLRMDMPGEMNAYMLVRGGKGYSVGRHGGRTMVLDMDSMRQMGQMAQGAGDSGPELAPEELSSLDSLEATGERETVAGIAGEVHRISWTDAGGTQHQDTAVLSEDPLARALTDAFGRSVGAISGRAEDPFGEAALARDLGVLRFSDKFKVVAISGDEPPGSQFELPAEPMSLQDLMRGGR